MRSLETIREFNTPNFRVVVCAEEEDESLDLSWDDDGSVLRSLQSGEFVAFCAHAYVVYKPTGAVLADDYLGACIYRSFAEFMDHKECGIENELLRSTGSSTVCGSYFSDMVYNVCRQAREAVTEMQSIKIRKGARS